MADHSPQRLYQFILFPLSMHGLPCLDCDSDDDDEDDIIMIAAIAFENFLYSRFFDELFTSVMSLRFHNNKENRYYYSLFTGEEVKALKLA